MTKLDAPHGMPFAAACRDLPGIAESRRGKFALPKTKIGGC
jgi:hypothetical protein